MNGIDLFAGAGGMSLGAVQAGIKVAIAVEADPYAALTYECNHPNTKVFQRDIRELADRQIKKIPRGSNGTIVFGGPPCQGFSYSNQRTRKLDNPENWLFREFLRVVRIWEPDVVVFENVQGIVNTEGGIFLKQVLAGLESLRYSTTHGVLNAAEFGVPQNRSRLFVLANRKAVGLNQLPLPQGTAHLTVQDAIFDLPQLENGSSVDCLPYRCNPKSEYARKMRGHGKTSPNHYVSRNAPSIIKRYKYVPPGGNWADIPAKLMRNYANRSRCHTGIYHRLRANEPSIVIGNFRKNMLIHPHEDRGLSVREAARIQSFPDSYKFYGSIGFQQQQVGNAVPPSLAAAVFQSIVLRKV